jgi:hypothetical protein
MPVYPGARCVFGESRRLGLLRGKDALLPLGELKELSRRFTMRLRHDTVLHLS